MAGSNLGRILTHAGNRKVAERVGIRYIDSQQSTVEAMSNNFSQSELRRPAAVNSSSMAAFLLVFRKNPGKGPHPSLRAGIEGYKVHSQGAQMNYAINP